MNGFEAGAWMQWTVVVGMAFLATLDPVPTPTPVPELHGLSDTVLLALIAAISGAFLSAVSLVLAYWSKQEAAAARREAEAAKTATNLGNAKLDTMSINIDGRLTELLKAKTDAAEARGELAGRDAANVRADVRAEGVAAAVETNRSTEPAPQPTTPPPLPHDGDTIEVIVEGKVLADQVPKP